jgi:hypothetical protein
MQLYNSTPSLQISTTTKDTNPVGILSLTNRLGLGAGICTGNILDTEWGQNLLCIPYISENVFRKNHRNIIKNKSAHSIHNLTNPT